MQTPEEYAAWYEAWHEIGERKNAEMREALGTLAANDRVRSVEMRPIEAGGTLVVIVVER